MRRPGVTINAAMLAAAIRIEAGCETDIRTVVARDDGPAVVLVKLRAWSLRTGIIVVRIPICVRFEMNFLEPVRRILCRAAMGGNLFLRRHEENLTQSREGAKARREGNGGRKN